MFSASSHKRREESAEIPLEPSLHQALQTQFSPPLLTGDVLQPLHHPGVLKGAQSTQYLPFQQCCAHQSSLTFRTQSSCPTANLPGLDAIRSLVLWDVKVPLIVELHPAYQLVPTAVLPAN